MEKPGTDGATETAPAGVARYELYDLLTDPGETANVAAEHPDVVKELMARLERIRNGASI